jgi:hypothetical protein
MQEPQDVEIERPAAPRPAPPGGSPLVFVPGAFLAGFGVLVIAVPDLLRWLVGGLFVLLGLGATVAAWRWRRFRRRASERLAGFAASFPTDPFGPR